MNVFFKLASFSDPCYQHPADGVYPVTPELNRFMHERGFKAVELDPTLSTEEKERILLDVQRLGFKDFIGAIMLQRKGKCRFVIDPLLYYEEYLKEIKNIAVRKYTAAVLNQLVPQHWLSASSTGGKYHPPDEVSFTGQAYLHEPRVMRMAIALSDLYGMPPAEKDQAIAAGLLHDVWKGGFIGPDGEPEWGYHTTYDHSVVGGQWLAKLNIKIGENPKAYGLTAAEWKQMQKNQWPLHITRAAYYHQGRWAGTPIRSTNSLIDFIVSQADYLAGQRNAVVPIRGETIKDARENAYHHLTQLSEEITEEAMDFWLHNLPEYQTFRERVLKRPRTQQVMLQKEPAHFGRGLRESLLLVERIMPQYELDAYADRTLLYEATTLAYAYMHSKRSYKLKDLKPSEKLSELGPETQQTLASIRANLARILEQPALPFAKATYFKAKLEPCVALLAESAIAHDTLVALVELDEWLRIIDQDTIAKYNPRHVEQIEKLSAYKGEVKALRALLATLRAQERARYADALAADAVDLLKKEALTSIRKGRRRSLTEEAPRLRERLVIDNWNPERNKMSLSVALAVAAPKLSAFSLVMEEDLKAYLAVLPTQASRWIPQVPKSPTVSAEFHEQVLRLLDAEVIEPCKKPFLRRLNQALRVSGRDRTEIETLLGPELVGNPDHVWRLFFRDGDQADFDEKEKITFVNDANERIEKALAWKRISSEQAEQLLEKFAEDTAHFFKREHIPSDLYVEMAKDIGNADPEEIAHWFFLRYENKKELRELLLNETKLSPVEIVRKIKADGVPNPPYNGGYVRVAKRLLYELLYGPHPAPVGSLQAVDERLGKLIADRLKKTRDEYNQHLEALAAEGKRKHYQELKTEDHVYEEIGRRMADMVGEADQSLSQLEEPRDLKDRMNDDVFVAAERQARLALLYGALDVSAFDGVVADPRGLWENLKREAYVDEDGCIQQAFIDIGKAENFVLDAAFQKDKAAIAAVMHRIVLESMRVEFGRSKIFRYTPSQAQSKHFKAVDINEELLKDPYRRVRHKGFYLEKAFKHLLDDKSRDVVVSELENIQAREFNDLPNWFIRGLLVSTGIETPAGLIAWLEGQPEKLGALKAILMNMNQAERKMTADLAEKGKATDNLFHASEIKFPVLQAVLRLFDLPQIDPASDLGNKLLEIFDAGVKGKQKIIATFSADGPLMGSLGERPNDPWPRRTEILPEMEQVFAPVLKRYGIESVEALKTLRQDQVDLALLDSYGELPDIEKCLSHLETFMDAVVSVVTAPKSKQTAPPRLMISGDYDADGITGSTIYMKGFREVLERRLIDAGKTRAEAREIFNATVDYYIPDRRIDGYGLRSRNLTRQMQAGFRYFITTDNGISNKKEIDTARTFASAHDLPQPVILITDHHTIPRVKNEDGEETDEYLLPEADAIVHPFITRNPKDKNYFLSGGALAYMVTRALYKREDARYQAAGKPGFEIGDQYLEYAYQSIVSDIVPVKGTCRTLGQAADIKIRRNMETLKTFLEEPEKYLLRADNTIPLLKDVDLGLDIDLSWALLCYERGWRFQDSLSREFIGFSFIPPINALGRISDGKLAVEYFMEDRPEEIYKRLRAMIINNENRRMLTETVTAQALADFERIQKEKPFEYDPSIPALVLPGKYDEGVMGIVAARLAEVVGGPVFVLDTSNAPHLKGSARTRPGFHILKALKRVERAWREAGHNEPFFAGLGGHVGAAGGNFLDTSVDNDLERHEFASPEFEGSETKLAFLSKHFQLAVAEQIQEKEPKQRQEYLVRGRDRRVPVVATVPAKTLNEFAYRLLETLAPWDSETFGAEGMQNGPANPILAVRNVQILGWSKIGKDGLSYQFDALDEDGFERRFVMFKPAVGLKQILYEAHRNERPVELAFRMNYSTWSKEVNGLVVDIRLMEEAKPS